MPTILGSGEHRYRVVEGWAKLPDGWELTDVASVAVDSKDRVYVFNRGTHPMIVFDRDGNFLKSWGEGLFSRAQGPSYPRTPRKPRALHERRAVPPLHPHCPVAEGRDLCLRRLRQCPRAQVHARRQIDQE